MLVYLATKNVAPLINWHNLNLKEKYLFKQVCSRSDCFLKCKLKNPKHIPTFRTGPNVTGLYIHKESQRRKLWKPTMFSDPHFTISHRTYSAHNFRTFILQEQIDIDHRYTLQAFIFQFKFTFPKVFKLF